MKNYLNNRQISFYLFGIIVGYGFINLPKSIVENAGTGGWISILLSTIIVSIFTYIVTYLGLIFKGKTFIQYSNLLLGKTLTFIISILYFIYFFLILSLITRISCETIKLIILPKTPVWMLSLFMFISIYYASTKGLQCIGRMCELYGVLIIFFILFIHTFMFLEGEAINLKPLLGEISFLSYFKSMLNTVIPFLGFEALLLVPFNEKNSKKTLYYSTGAVFFIGLLYIFAVESCIALMGTDDIIYYNDVVLTAIRRLRLPYLEFLKRLDGLFLLAWILSIFSTTLIFLYSASELIKNIFKNFGGNLKILLLLILSFITTILPISYETVQKMLVILGYCGIFIAFFMPLIFLIIAKVKRYDKKIS